MYDDTEQNDGDHGGKEQDVHVSEMYYGAQHGWEELGENERKHETYGNCG